MIYTMELASILSELNLFIFDDEWWERRGRRSGKHTVYTENTDRNNRAISLRYKVYVLVISNRLSTYFTEILWFSKSEIY